MAKELRNYFVYYIPISIHNELHNHLLHDVPKPPPEAMKPLYLAWKEQKGILDHFGIIEALEWLEKACEYDSVKPYAAYTFAKILLDSSNILFGKIHCR